MIAHQTIEVVANEISALDFSAENATVAALEEERIAIEAAMTRAKQRLEEIGRTIRESREPEGAAVAAALLADAPIPVENLRALEEERDALLAGHRDLNRRHGNIWNEVCQARFEVFGKAGQASEPLAIEILAAARAAGETIRRAHGAMRALSAATGTNPTGANAIAATYQAMIASEIRLIEPAGEVPVDQGLCEVLNLLQGKGDAMRGAKIGPTIAI